MSSTGVCTDLAAGAPPLALPWPRAWRIAARAPPKAMVADFMKLLRCIPSPLLKNVSILPVAAYYLNQVKPIFKLLLASSCLAPLMQLTAAPAILLEGARLIVD